MASSVAEVPIVQTITVSKVPQHKFERLTLPRFHATLNGDDDPPYRNRGGEDSSHMTLSGPPGLDEKHPPIRTSINEVKAAIIHCEGAMENGQPRRFEPITIPAMEAAFHADDQPCSVPSIIGLPIWMRPYQHNPAINRANPGATWLHVIGDLNARGFGFVSKTWLDSAVVARVDGRDLFPQHLEVLSFFCKHVFEEVIGKKVGRAGLSRDAETREMQKKRFRHLASRKGFLDFYEKYCNEKAEEDENWRDLPYPFDDDDLGEYGQGHMHSRAMGNREILGESMPRRSGRQTRVTPKAVKKLGPSTSETEDEARGRSRKRPFSDEE